MKLNRIMKACKNKKSPFANWRMETPDNGEQWASFGLGKTNRGGQRRSVGFVRAGEDQQGRRGGDNGGQWVSFGWEG